MGSFTAQEKYREATRELKVRMRVYPRWIENDRISQDEADRRIAIMDQIAQDYLRIVEGERLL